MKGFIIAIFLFAGILHSGGWDNSLIGSRAIGMATAFCGLADDPSALYHNTAGLVTVEPHISLVLQGVYIMPTHLYRPETQNSFSLSKRNSFLPQFFLKLGNPSLSFGIGFYVPFGGGGEKWTKEEIGQDLEGYEAISAFSFGISKRLSSEVSFGVLISRYMGKLDYYQDSAGIKTENSESGTSWTFGLSALVKVSKKLQFGIRTIMPAKMKMEGKIKSEKIPEIDHKYHRIESSFRLPFNMEIGLAYRISPFFTFTFDIDYSNWSVLDSIVNQIYLDTGILRHAEPLLYKNSLKTKFGIELGSWESNMLRAGFAIDPNTVPDNTLGLLNIDATKYNFFMGFTRKVSKLKINTSLVRSIGKKRKYNSRYYSLKATIISADIVIEWL